MIILDFSVVPVGTGSASISKFVASVQKALEDAGWTPHLHPMGTTIEAETLDDALEAVRVGHEAVFATGAVRVATTVRIDERRDKEGSMKQKMDSVKQRLGDER